MTGARDRSLASWGRLLLRAPGLGSSTTGVTCRCRRGVLTAQPMVSGGAATMSENQ